MPMICDRRLIFSGALGAMIAPRGRAVRA